MSFLNKKIFTFNIQRSVVTANNLLKFVFVFETNTELPAKDENLMTKFFNMTLNLYLLS